MEQLNPYSAEHPAPPSKFAGRKKQLAEFEGFLADTLSGNSKNIAVLGEWGIGKTSLLRMFKELAERQKCIATIIELDETISTEGLFRLISRSLAKDARARLSLPAKAREYLDTLSLGVEYGSVGLSLKKQEREPDTLRFREDLVKIYEHSKAPFIIMLDNAEHLFSHQGVLFALRNVFQHIQSMDGVRCMLILSGKETLFSDIRSASEPVSRFFWGIELGPFTGQETQEAIEKPLKGTPISFDMACIGHIHKLSQGHPYFVQVFAYNLCRIRDKNKLTNDLLERIYPETLTYLGKRLFDGLIQKLSQRERETLFAFSKSKKDILTNKDVRESVAISSLNKYLKNLSETEPPVLLKLNRGQYALLHPLFKAYLRGKGADQSR